MTLLGTIGISEANALDQGTHVHDHTESGPMRSMETLLDANRAISEDLPAGSWKRLPLARCGKAVAARLRNGAGRGH